MAKIRKSRKCSRKTKKVWQLQEAKARFSELVNEVEHGEYQVISKNGQEVAIIISKEEFENMQNLKILFWIFSVKSPIQRLI
jgi:prevent-host-death family protein